MCDIGERELLGTYALNSNEREEVSAVWSARGILQSVTYMVS